jgi:hypothetical protein
MVDVRRMSSHRNEHALFERIGAAFATVAFWVQMLIVAEAGHAMPGIPILAMLATPFLLFALVGVGRVWIVEDGVKVINTGRSFLIPWDDIERFSMGRRGLVRKVGIAELHDGRRIAMWGIQGPNAATRRSDVAAARLIAAMNAELERRRPRAVETPESPVAAPAAERELAQAGSRDKELYLVASR